MRFGRALTGVLFALTLPTAAAAADGIPSMGISGGDVRDYKAVTPSIASCANAQTEDPDFMHPPADTDKLTHIANLFGQCRAALKSRNVSIGVMRVNDLFLGMTCVALGAINGSAGDLPACNLPSSLPAHALK